MSKTEHSHFTPTAPEQTVNRLLNQTLSRIQLARQLQLNNLIIRLPSEHQIGKKYLCALEQAQPSSGDQIQIIGEMELVAEPNHEFSVTAFRNE